MPFLSKPLTDTKVKNLKPADKPFKCADGGGLYLYILPHGSKLWRMSYRFSGKYKTLSFGSYPIVSLKDAREKREVAKKLLSQKKDPGEIKKEEKLQQDFVVEGRFENIALDWHRHWSVGKNEKYAKQVWQRLQDDVFPTLGDLPIDKINIRAIIHILREIENRGAGETAKRLLQTCGLIFRYANINDLTQNNPCAGIKPTDILKASVTGNYARLSETELPQLLKAIEAYQGNRLTGLALKIMAYCFPRTGELIGAKWEEINFDKKEWRIPARRMKMKTEHIIPLARQVIVLLRDLQELSGGSEFLFPGNGRATTMSNNTLLGALAAMGYKGRMTGHGFRGVASTILHERGYDHKHIELQLAHIERNKVSAAYNHALYLKERAGLMQDWADFLDNMKV